MDEPLNLDGFGYHLTEKLSGLRGYEAAVEWVSLTSTGMVIDGKLVLPRIEPREDIHCNYLGIFWLPNDLDHAAEDKSGCYVCDNDAIEKLLNICEQDGAAFDICKKISAHRLATNGEMLPALKTFTALYMLGLIHRPKMRRRTATWLRNRYLLTSAKLASDAFGLDLTRGDDKQGECESGCDAVVDGLAKHGHHISFRAVKELCIGSKKEAVSLRRELDEVAASIKYATEHHEIARQLFHRDWHGVGLKKLPPS